MTDPTAKPLGPKRSHPLWKLAQSSYPPRRAATNYMLYQDLTKAQFAYRPQIVSDHPSAEQALVEMLQDFSGIGESNINGWRADRSVMTVIDHVAHEHLAFGKCLIEVHTADTADEKDHSAAGSGQHGPVRLSALSGHHTRIRFGRIRQRVPDSLVSESLKDATLLRPTLANGLARDLQTVSRLYAIAEKSRPGARNLTASERPQEYDFALHTRRQHEALAIVTSSIGWDGRHLFLGRSTSSHQVWRELKFRRVWVEIATATIDALNEVTSNPGYLYEPFIFNLSGVPTCDELTAGMDALRSGAESVDAVTRRLLLPRRPEG